MRRIKFLLYGLALLCAADTVRAAAWNDKPPIVYVNGEKFYVHIVSAGETLYSISRRYGVDMAEILEYNPSAADGLKPDVTMKIPVTGGDVVQNTEKKRRRDYETHTVAAGETLYSVSRIYSVSVGTLLEDNPETDPAHISVGTKLYVRKSAMGTAADRQMQVEAEPHRETENKTSSDGYIYYTVRSGDTLYSLSRRFDTAPETIVSLNGLSEGLRAGETIKLPASVSAAADEQPTENDVAPSASARMFGVVTAGRPVRMALLLPLTRNGAINGNYADFYRGFLLGLEHLKEHGISAEVTLCDTEQNPDTAASLAEDILPALRPDIIVGPVYENELASVTAYAEGHNVPVVSPLASLVSSDSGVLFQMSPDLSHKYDKVADLFDDSREVTLLYGHSVDREFEQEILSQLNGKRFVKKYYSYDNKPDERRENGGSSVGFSAPADLSGLLRGSGDRVFVIMSDNETEVDRIMAAIASAEISLKARERTAADFVVLGNPKWLRFPNLDRAVFFNNRVVILTSYYAQKGLESVDRFDERYITEYDAVPTPYAYRGYDAAVIFGEGMYGDIADGMTGKRYAPLQTGYTFGRVGDGQRTVNGEWVRINYHDDCTVVVE